MRFLSFIILFGILSQSIFDASAQRRKRKLRSKKLIHQADCYRQIKTGIEGKVEFKEGNFMPSPDGSAGKNSGKGVRRMVLIYPLIKETDTRKEGNFYTKIKKKPITRFYTTDNGCFRFTLMPGKYSMLVKEKAGFYANGFDGEGNIYPIEVKESEITKVDFQITYMAVY